MRMIIFFFAIALLTNCVGNNQPRAKLRYKGEHKFEVELENVDGKYCISEHFLDYRGSGRGQSIEVIDYKGDRQLFNAGFPIENEDVQFRAVRSRREIYILDQNYIINHNAIYKARLNIYAFECGHDLRKYSYFSFEHANYYGNPKINHINIRSNWISFELR